MHHLSLYSIFDWFYKSVIDVDILSSDQGLFLSESDKGRNSWSKVPWIFFFFPSSKVSTAYQRTLSTGFCLHSLNDNSTVPWLLFLAVILGEVLEDSRSKGCWTETTQFRRILYSTLSSLSLSFPVSLSVSAFNPSVSFSDSCLFHILVFVFNLTWRCAHQCLLELSYRLTEIFRTTAFLLLKVFWKTVLNGFGLRLALSSGIFRADSFYFIFRSSGEPAELLKYRGVNNSFILGAYSHIVLLFSLNIWIEYKWEC